MYIFEVKIERSGKRITLKKSVEIDEFYTLREAWHNAIEVSIHNLADDERITSIELIAW